MSGLLTGCFGFLRVHDTYGPKGGSRPSVPREGLEEEFDSLNLMGFGVVVLEEVLEQVDTHLFTPPVLVVWVV